MKLMEIKLLTLFAVLGLGVTNFIACSADESQNTEEPTMEAEPEEEADSGLDEEGE